MFTIGRVDREYSLLTEVGVSMVETGSERWDEWLSSALVSFGGIRGMRRGYICWGVAAPRIITICTNRYENTGQELTRSLRMKSNYRRGSYPA